VTLDVNDTVAFLTLGGSGSPVLSGVSRTLGVDSLLTINAGAQLDLTNTALNGVGNLANLGTLRLQNTSVALAVQNSALLIARSNATLNGAVTTSLGSTFRVEGDASCCSANVSVATGFTNNGAIELTAISGSGTASQLNVTTGTLTNAVSGTISSLVGNGGARTLAAELDNQGTVTIAQPLTLTKASAAHVSGGTMTVAANLSLNQSGTTPSFTSTGTITVALGTTVSVSSGAFNYNAGAIGGLGSIAFSGTTLALGQSITNDTLQLSFTNSTVNGPGVLTNAAAATLVLQNTAVNAPMANAGLLRARSNTAFNGTLTNVLGAILRIEGDASCCSANVTVANSFTNNGAIELTAIAGSGTSSQLNVTAGTLTNAVGGTISSLVGNGGSRTLAAQLANQGTVTVAQPLTLTKASAAHTNSGTLTVAANLSLSQSGTTPSFTNTGTITVAGGVTLAVSSGALNYTGGAIGGLGTIDFSSATLGLGLSLTNDTLHLSFTNSTVNGPGTLTNAAGATLVVQNTVVNAPMDNLGLVRARSSTTFNSTLTNVPGAILRIEGDASCCSANVTVATGFTNTGAIELTAISGSGTSSQLNVTAGTLTNAVGGTISSLVGNGGSRTLAAQLANLGTVTITHPLTLSKASATHTNSGTLTVGANLSLTQSGATPSFTTTGTITVASGVTLAVSSGAFTYSAGAIGGLGTVDFSSATLGLGLGLTNDTLHVSFINSTVNGPGTLTNAVGATLVVQNTAVNAPMANAGLLRARSNTAFNGTLTNVLGAILRIEGDASCCSANVTVANSFTNNGAIELTAIAGSGTSSQLNVTNGTLTNAGTGTISALVGNGGSRTLAAQLANQGTVTIAQPLTLSKASAAHTNNGTVTVAANLGLTQSGTTPSFTNTGTITIALGTALSVSSGAFNYTSGAIGGLGSIDFSGATLDMTPNFTNDTLHLSFTNSTVNGSGILGNAAGATLVLQNTVINTGMGNQGLLRARSNSAFNGAFSNAGGSAILRIEGDASCCSANVTVASGFTNNGSIELTAINGSGTSSQLNVTSGILTNASGASIKSLPGNGGARTLTAQVDNQGTMSISQAMTLTFPAAGQVNSGLIQLTGGDLTVVLSGFRPGFANDPNGVIDVGTNKLVINNQSTGTFLNNAGATLRGAGTIDIGTASFITNGITTVGGASPGFLNFVGTYVQGPTPSVMNVRIGGDPAKPGVDYDQLRVTSGSANLQGGILNVTVGTTQPGSYVVIQLPVGQTFTGNFAQINFSANCDLFSGPLGNQYLLTCQ
jgi:ribosomal 50S subunit-recycling heat shock protein